MKNPGSWENSGIRRQAPALLRDYLIRKITFAETEKDIHVRRDSKSVRFDVYVEDEQGTLYDIENIEGKAPKGKFTETIADAVEAAKENKEMKVEYMTFFMELRRREEKGRAEGLAEGEAKGTIKGRAGALIELVQDGLLTMKEAAKRAGMSEEAFRKLAAL